MQKFVARSKIASQRLAHADDCMALPDNISRTVGNSPKVGVDWTQIHRKSFLIVFATAFLCMALQPAFANGGWLSQCLSEGSSDLSDAECYVEYTNRLKREQAGVIKRIRIALSRKGPEETDYPKALVLLNQSQKKWSMFKTSDCAIVTEVFGGGNAVGFAEETCVIDHYRVRNAQLKQLETEYLSN
jgi:uncharacterized protein YecT (DUF1311 family)